MQCPRCGRSVPRGTCGTCSPVRVPGSEGVLGVEEPVPLAAEAGRPRPRLTAAVAAALVVGVVVGATVSQLRSPEPASPGPTQVAPYVRSDGLIWTATWADAGVGRARLTASLTNPTYAAVDAVAWTIPPALAEHRCDGTGPGLVPTRVEPLETVQLQPVELCFPGAHGLAGAGPGPATASLGGLGAVANARELAGPEGSTERTWLTPGASVALRVRETRRDQSHATEPMPGTAWTSSDPAVAVVDSEGMVTALTTGETLISATSLVDGRTTPVTGSILVVVHPSP